MELIQNSNFPIQKALHELRKSYEEKNEKAYIQIETKNLEDVNQK